MRLLTRLAALVLVLLAPVTAQAQVLWEIDTSAGAYPLANFDAESDEEYGLTVNRSRVAGAGPDGQAVYRFTFLHRAASIGSYPNGGEHYLGWFVDTGTAPTSGQSRFLRFRFRIASGSNFRAVSSSTGATGSRVIHKLAIIGDSSTHRPIISVQGSPDASVVGLQLGLNGGGETEVNVSPGVWYDIQTEVRFGAGGYLKIWQNNDTYASPSDQATGLTITNSLGDMLSFGFYMNQMISSDGVYGVDVTDVEYAASFDSTWAAGGGAAAPDAPTIGTATSGNGQCSVTFTAPADDGGSAITGYTVTSSPGGLTGTGASSPIVVPGLTNGVAYTFTAVATNAIGSSPPSSASNSCTPLAPALARPARVRVKGDSSQ